MNSRQLSAFYGFCFLYIWLRIQPHLIFHVQEPIFFSGWSFFCDFLQFPGGIAAYIGAFAGQSYAYGWMGALVITLVMVGIGLSAREYLHVVTDRLFDFVPFVASVLLIILQNRYHYDLSFHLSLLVVLSAAAILARLSPSNRTPYFILVGPVIYWVAGGGWLLFALLSAIREIIDCRRVRAVTSILVGVALPWMATVTIYPGLLSDAYTRLLPLTGPYLLYESRLGIAAAVLYLFLPVVTLVTACARPVIVRIHGLIFSTVRIALVLIGAILIYGTFDGNYRTMIEIDYQARQRNWQAVLSLVSNLTAYDVLTVYNVQLALCHSGRLSHDLFSYPHLENAPIFVPSPETPSRLVALGDYLLEIGYVNKAEHMLQEALEIIGNQASILRRLVVVNVLKDRPNAARVYLGLLIRSPLNHAWAEKFLVDLETDPRREDDPIVNRLRKIMVEVDYPGYFSAEDILRQLLDRNPKNLFALDLLMGHYLQTAQPEKIVQNIPRLSMFPDVFPGKSLPRLYEEAVMLWATHLKMQTGSMPDLPIHGRQISVPTQKRYMKFSQLLNAYPGNSVGAMRELAKEYRDTFWYYYLYRGYRGAGPFEPIISRATYLPYQ